MSKRIPQPRGAVAPQQGAALIDIITRAADLGIWDWDLLAGSFVYSSKAREICGFTLDQPVTLDDVRAATHPEDLPHTWAMSQMALDPAVRATPRYEYRLIRADNGAVRWVVAHGEAMFEDIDGIVRAVRYVGTLQDITDRKAGEAALLDSRNRFQTIADSAPSPLWMTSATGEIEFVNQAFADHAGVAKQEVLGDVWLRMIHPDDLQSVAERRLAARAALTPYEFEARFRNAAGEYRHMLAHSKPRTDGNGTFEGYVGMAVDVTEMRRAQEALRESEARFRLIAEDSPVMMWLGDENGGCIYLNRALRDFWGVPEDLTGFTWGATLLEEDRDGLFAAFGAAMARQEAFEVEARYIRADGAVRWLATRAQPRRDAAGRFLGMIGVNTDDTELREGQARQRLLINELNHRVKNSLAAVQSIVRQSLRDDMTLSQARGVLIERLMALSAAHNILTERNWEGAGLGEVVAEALRPFDDVRESRFDIDGADVRLSPTTALALSMALHELATNAVKYGALSVSAGRVSLAWARTAGRPAITLQWRERGGPPVRPPTRTGFGARLLQSGLAADMGERARLSFDPGGVTATLEIRVLDGAEGQDPA